MDDTTRHTLETTLSERDRVVFGLTTGGGDELLDFLCEHLVLGAEADFALVGELNGLNWDRINTLATRAREGPIETFGYSLDGSPCHNVIRDKYYAFPSDLAAHFPNHQFLNRVGAQAYVGYRLQDASERPLGVLVAVYQRPLTTPEIDRYLRLLEAWTDRAGAELARRRALTDLQSVFAVTGPTGRDALRVATMNLSKALGTAGAYVARRVEGGGYETCALYFQDGFYPAVALSESDLNTRLLSEARSSRGAHPIARSLPDLRNLIGRELLHGDRTIGGIGLLDDQGILGDPEINPVFEAFSHRVRLELERLEVEDARLKAERILTTAQHRDSMEFLVGAVSHDLNNVLTAAASNVQLLDADLDGEQADIAADLDLALTRASELARELLVLSGRRSRSRSILDWGQLVGDVIRMVRVVIPADCELVTALPPRPLYVRGDSAQLNHVVLNLFSNAVQALMGPGRIRFSLRPEPLSALAEPAIVRPSNLGQAFGCLEVEDTGVGIHSADVPRIFEPYYTTKANGQGMGLSAIRGILQSHGGGLSVRSALNQGTTFQIFLPLSEEG